MTSSKIEDTMRRGELLVHLRHGIRHSARLAEQLAEDRIVGGEARALLGRLCKIRLELEDLSFSRGSLRYPINDPFWGRADSASGQEGAS